jgi:hypothetical protein
VLQVQALAALLLLVLLLVLQLVLLLWEQEHCYLLLQTEGLQQAHPFLQYLLQQLLVCLQS